jgi:hypothetical protein
VNAHVDSSSNKISNSEDSYDPNTESVQSDIESVHPYADADTQQRPKWAQTTLQDAMDLIGDPTNTRRTRSNFEEPTISLTAIEPFPFRNIFLV